MAFDRLHTILGTLLVLGVGYRALASRTPADDVPAAALERAPRPAKAASRTGPRVRKEPKARVPDPPAIREETTPAGAQPPRTPGRRLARQDARGRIDINHAGVEVLASLPGIGAALAERIVEDRGRRGNFRSQADLQRVTGIGVRLAMRLAGYVTFDGAGRPTSEDSGAGRSVRDGAEKSRRVRPRSPGR